MGQARRKGKTKAERIAVAIQARQEAEQKRLDDQIAVAALGLTHQRRADIMARKFGRAEKTVLMLALAGLPTPR